MQTMALDDKKELTVSLFKNRTDDTFYIKIRVMDSQSLEKQGILLKVSHEALRRLFSIPEGQDYPSIDLGRILSTKGYGLVTELIGRQK